MKQIKTLGLVLLSCSALSACADNAVTDNKPDIWKDSSAPYEQSKESLALTQLGDAYKKNPQDVKRAIAYAAALREVDYLNRAAVVLAPFAGEPDSPAAAKTEYAAIQLKLGNYTEAENAARRAIKQDPAAFEPYHYLAITLDAQGDYERAESYFRKALESWKGDPVTVMNNLALNLAAQEKLSEARKILEDALAIAPEREEIQRNLRIIKALKETKG